MVEELSNAISNTSKEVEWRFPAAPQGIESVVELANNQMRKTIAKRLGFKFTAPHYYLGVE